jgi:hypothetical protein
MKTTNKTIIGMAITATLLFNFLLLSAAIKQGPIQVKNIVLVHGAFVDGSGWKPVYDILIKRGYHVSVVQQPLTSFQNDLAAVQRVLDMQTGPCILVGHSYGGGLITEAGNDPFNQAGWKRSAKPWSLWPSLIFTLLTCLIAPNTTALSPPDNSGFNRVLTQFNFA